MSIKLLFLHSFNTRCIKKNERIFDCLGTYEIDCLGTYDLEQTKKSEYQMFQIKEGANF